MGKQGKRGNSSVGYGKPPIEHRFTTTNQPPRSKRASSGSGKTLTELGLETVNVMLASGQTERMSYDDVIIERTVEQALRGDVRSARELYLHLDKEALAFAERRPVLSARKRRELVRRMGAIIAPFIRIDKQLRARGFVEVRGGERVVTDHARVTARARDHRHYTS